MNGISKISMLSVLAIAFLYPSQIRSNPVLPENCVTGLLSIVECLNVSNAQETSVPNSNTDIIHRCSGLTNMAKCTAKIPKPCWALPDFKELEMIFGFAERIAEACASERGKKNMLALSNCNNKIRQNFEQCFDFSKIDKALSFGSSSESATTHNFSEMCCVMKNGKQCYEPKVTSACGTEGKMSLDETIEFLLTAMQCDPKIKC